jgi:hypothetical protein
MTANNWLLKLYIIQKFAVQPLLAQTSALTAKFHQPPRHFTSPIVTLQFSIDRQRDYTKENVQTLNTEATSGTALGTVIYPSIIQGISPLILNLGKFTFQPLYPWKD